MANGGTRHRAGSLLAVLLLAGSLFGLGAVGLLVRTTPAQPTRPARGGAAPPPVVDAGSLSSSISSLQARLRAAPSDWRSFARLGLAYVQQARVSADPTYYPKAEGVLERSLRLHAVGNFEASAGMASLAAARHDFAGALGWAERAVALNPHSADAYAILGDAQVELGRYDDAFATFQTAVDLKPELSTYARVSYAWELQGNVGNAARAMELALQAAGSPSDAAWAANQLGDLAWGRGALDEAGRWYRLSMARDPTFVPPHAGLARLAAAGGKIGRAVAGYRWVVARAPAPEYVIALGDVLSVAGRRAESAREYALLRIEEDLFRANGVNVDLEIALFDADHHVELAGGLAAARSEWSRRRSVTVADALAWQLFANGRFEEALGFSDQALRLGTENALFLFHRGMIERALGRDRAARTDLARALALNPSFSVRWSGVAARTLEGLGGRP